MSETGQLPRQDLHTSRLTLRRLRPADAPAVFAILNDWDVVRMLASVPWPLTLSEVEDHAARQSEANPDSEEFVIWAANAVVGVAGVKRPGSGDPPRTMPRLGYWIGRSFWGCGYAGEAVAAVTAYAFRRFPAERIGAGVFHDNPASRRLLEKLGFASAGSYDTLSIARGVAVPTADLHLSRATFEKSCL